ncbi:MAG: type III-B CRISPR module RAMP protein Cmr6 [Desulfohalobiaceae bacterium]|nr:type III-B CRISPR module RAMP protein Cmr6 [Desulfohalobiaceae bacterium]
MFYPFYEELQEIAKDFPKQGNFGLWYNKLIPVIGPATHQNGSVSYKVCGDRSDANAAKSLYLDQYPKFKQAQKDLLVKKHLRQAEFCRHMAASGCGQLIFSARLKSPLLCGIGQSHPSETSITLDHLIGLPYIPASSVKGMVRLGHLINIITENNPEYFPADFHEGKTSFNDEDERTFVPEVFGTQSNRGKVVFLDAYPVAVPDLKEDIINPHYKDYYRDENPEPPADNQDPKPVKFLTVAKEAEFVFRMIFKPNLGEKGREFCRTGLVRVLTQEGIGSKTSLGFGRFDILSEDEHQEIKKHLLEHEQRQQEEKEKQKRLAEEQKMAEMGPDELQMFKIEKLKGNDQEIAEMVKSCLEGNYGADVFLKLKEKLQALNLWSPSKFKKQKKEKVKKRNASIEDRIKSS